MLALKSLRAVANRFETDWQTIPLIVPVLGEVSQPVRCGSAIHPEFFALFPFGFEPRRSLGKNVE